MNSWVMARKAGLVGAVVLALVVGVTGQSLGASARAPQNLSGASSVQPPGAADGETQPQVAVDPNDQRRFAVAWDQQATDGFEIVVALSADDGRTWTQAVAPGLDTCGSPIAPAAVADPSISFGADGRLYLSALCYLPGTTYNEQLVTSLSRLRQWGPAVSLGLGTRGRIVADPTVAGAAYIAYLDFGIADAFHSVLSRRTSDGGRTWSAATTVYAAQGDGAVVPGLALTGHGPRGATLVVAFHAGIDTNVCCTFTIAVRSTDGGAKWEDPVRVPGDGTDYNNAYATDPNGSGATVYAGSGDGVNVAGDGAGGAFAVWSDLNPGTRDPLDPGDHTGRVLVARMTTASDGSASWGIPHEVDSTTADPSSGAEVFEPTISVGNDGTVGVVYYDDASSRAMPGTWAADLWYAVSYDGGVTWARSHVAGPFDIGTAAASGFTDYIGIAAAPDGFLASYVLGPGLTGPAGANEGQTDVFLSLLRR